MPPEKVPAPRSLSTIYKTKFKTASLRNFQVGDYKYGIGKTISYVITDETGHVSLLCQVVGTTWHRSAMDRSISKAVEL